MKATKHKRKRKKSTARRLPPLERLRGDALPRGVSAKMMGRDKRVHLLDRCKPEDDTFFRCCAVSQAFLDLVNCGCPYDESIPELRKRSRDAKKHPVNCIECLAAGEAPLED